MTKLTTLHARRDVPPSNIGSVKKTPHEPGGHPMRRKQSHPTPQKGDVTARLQSVGLAVLPGYVGGRLHARCVDLARNQTGPDQYTTNHSWK